MYTVPAFAALLLPTACTNDVAVTASLQQREIVFAIPSQSGARGPCLDYAVVRDARGIITREIGDPADGSRACVAANLLRYGTAPGGVATMQSAQPLAAGESYALVASPGSLRAAFRYNGPDTAPTNYEPKSAEWCAVQHRGSTPDGFGCVMH